MSDFTTIVSINYIRGDFIKCGRCRMIGSEAKLAAQISLNFWHVEGSIIHIIHKKVLIPKMVLWCPNLEWSSLLYIVVSCNCFQSFRKLGKDFIIEKPRYKGWLMWRIFNLTSSGLQSSLQPTPVALLWNATLNVWSRLVDLKYSDYWTRNIKPS